MAKKLALTLDQHSIISIADVAGRITFVNEKFCNISGYSANELIGQNHRILKSGHHPDSFYKDMWDCISQGKTWQGIICNQRKDGSQYWVESSIVPFLDSKGNPCQYISARTDITATIINEERLTRSQSFANIGTWDWNIQTGDLFWSDRIAPMFGYTRNHPDPSYENFIAAIHPDDRQKVTDAINHCVEQGSNYNIEHRVIWQDGSTHWLHEKGNIVRSHDGTPLHMLGVVRDITQRRYQEQIQKGRSLILEEIILDKPLDDILTTMIQYAEEMQPGMKATVLLVDESGQHLVVGAAPSLPDFYNEALQGSKIAADAGSCGAAAYTGERRIANDIQSHPHWKSLRHLAKQAGIGSCWSEPIISSSGHVLGTFAMYHPTAKEPDNESLMLAVELSQYASIAIEQIQARKNLLSAKEEAEKANKAKSEFLSSMSHELRTPLNAILGFSQLLQMSSQNLQQHQLDDINDIHRAGEHLLVLINDILDLAKIEAGDINLSIETVLMADILSESINMITNQAIMHNININLAVNGCQLDHNKVSKLDIKVKADKTRLKQAIINLLTNAIKYNKINGSITISCEIVENNRLRINITDTGEGLSINQQKELFQPFHRLGAENTNIEGTGIGLVITKNIISQMNGRMGVESTPGTGSTFWIELPIDNGVATATNTRKDETMNTTHPDIQTTHTILYIEDNPSNIRLVAQLLKHRPHIKLIEAHEPVLGMNLAFKNTPDLILLDINLPGMNGFDVLKQLRKNNDLNNTPVFAVSANAMDEDIEKGKNAGFDNYITKPLDTVAFLRTIDKVLK
ncbi:MAG: PAS domain-containing protein [Gammaproteobacteria bacterium]|nr:PAS domain-containing protein [Gammaproteobacteria bacterium]MDH5734977.1 PAS domain-containing protein [Gammaproteobacteria bacterium]